MLIVVTGAFLQLVVGATQAASAHKVRQQQQAMLASALESLRTDGSWATRCEKTTPCEIDVSTVPAVQQIVRSNRDYAIRGDAIVYDSVADDEDGDDADGTTADFFEVHLRVLGPAGSNAKPISSTTVLDPINGGSFGAVNVRVCQVTGQADERLTFADCTGPRDMDGPAGSDDTWEDVPSDRRRVDIAPVRTNVIVRSVDITPPISFTARTDADGFIKVGGLPTGAYELAPAMPADARLWTSKSQPEAIAHVQPFDVVDATLVYQLTPPSSYAVRLQTGVPSDRSTWTDGAQRDVKLRLRPYPNDRLDGDLPFAEAPDGATQIVFTNLEPGLYSAQVQNGKGGREQLYDTVGYVWIMPPSGSDPATLGATYLIEANPASGGSTIGDLDEVLDVPASGPACTNPTMHIPFSDPPLAEQRCQTSDACNLSATSSLGLRNAVQECRTPLACTQSASWSYSSWDTAQLCLSGTSCDQKVVTRTGSRIVQQRCFAVESCTQDTNATYRSQQISQECLATNGTCDQKLQVSTTSSESSQQICSSPNRCTQQLYHYYSGVTVRQWCNRPFNVTGTPSSGDVTLVPEPEGEIETSGGTGGA